MTTRGRFSEDVEENQPTRHQLDPGVRSAFEGVCQHDIVDRAYYEEIAGKLRALLIVLSDRLPEKDVRLIGEFIDANELGLALEQIADVLSEDEHPLSATERMNMLALVDRMGMDQRVPQALAFCPNR